MYCKSKGGHLCDQIKIFKSDLIHTKQGWGLGAPAPAPGIFFPKEE